MKILRFLLIEFFLLAPLPFQACLDGQNVQKRMTYKGIPLTGSVSRFQRELEGKGFAAPEKEGDAEYRGEFAGYPARVLVLASPSSRTVFGTRTRLEEHPNWKQIENDYDTFRFHLSEVYGKPSSQNQSFQSPYYRGDGFSMKALSEGKVEWESSWSTKEGIISIRIQPSKRQGYGYVEIEYLDRIGLEIQEKERTDIIRNDL